MQSPNRIQVFEHHTLEINKTYNHVKFERHHYVALSNLNTLHNNKYFRVMYNGICFKQYVGVIQVDGLTIEVLPKIDNTTGNEAVWQNVLIDMLYVTKKINVEKIGNANVNEQNVHLLDIYFEWFLQEVQLLIHQGLIKQYYKETGNVKALKGKLEFAGHIQKNIVHKERFYTTHQVYEKDHLIHQILFKALDIVSRFSKGTYLYSKCKSVQTDFREVQNIPVTKETFRKVIKSRKNRQYTTALEIARFIILNYAPDISQGNEDMLALLFDMNNLWENYILERLKETPVSRDLKIHGQQSKSFWNGIYIRPDIVIEKVKEKKEDNEYFIIDTKWKNINYSSPSTNDLRQMYVYNEYWTSTKAMLLYPSNKTMDFKLKNFEFLDRKESHHECGLGKISIFKEDSKELNETIGTTILQLFGLINDQE